MRAALFVGEGRLGSSCPRRVTEHILLEISDEIDKKLA